MFDRHCATLKTQVQELALVKGRQHDTTPSRRVHIPELRSESGGNWSGRCDASLRSLNTQVPEIVSGTETLAGVVERIGVKIQEWEDECTADGEEGPENPTPRQSTTSDRYPFNPTHPVRAEPGVRLPFRWERAGR